MYKNSKYNIQSTKFRYKIGLYSTVHGSAVQRRSSRPSSSVQSREKLLDQAEVASNGELQAFRYAVLHLEDGGGSTGRGRCNLTSNCIVVVPMPSSRVEVSAETGCRGIRVVQNQLARRQR